MNAKEMFEKLGFHEEKSALCINYVNRDEKGLSKKEPMYIQFNIDEKVINMTDFYGYAFCIKPKRFKKLSKAIIKKCEELQWI